MTNAPLPNAHAGRGHRITQPSETREHRKPPATGNIVMCDGTETSQRVYDSLLSTSKQKFRGTHNGCAQAVRQAIPKEQWAAIIAWIDEHRPQFGTNSTQEDNLVALLIGYAARKRQQNVACLFDEIVQKRSAHMLLRSN